MGRTKPPPFAFVGQLEGIVSATDGKKWYRYPMSDHRGGQWHSSPEAALASLWREYDRITLPARVALLRELAAELEWIDDGICCKYIRDRADALEGKP